MNRYYYDLHIHSCLSPCGDDDSTPANIAGMAALNGLQIAALTDHNTTKNCPAFFKAAKKLGVIPIAGMEITTSEDIHAICLFPSLEAASEFGDEVEKRRILIKNRTDIFGNQFIMDEDDNVIAQEPNLLINATEISLEEAFLMSRRYGGISYPAHIDRQANGVVSALGAFPEDIPYTAYELNDGESDDEYKRRFPVLGTLKKVVSSDAHYLYNISEAVNSFELEDEPYSGALVASNLIKYLLGES